MGIMVCSFLWVMQDLYHQQFSIPCIHPIRGFRRLGNLSLGLRASGPVRFARLMGSHEGLKQGFRA